MSFYYHLPFVEKCLKRCRCMYVCMCVTSFSDDQLQRFFFLILHIRKNLMESNFWIKTHCLEMHHVWNKFPPKTLVALFWKSNQMIFLKSFLMIGQYQNKMERKPTHPNTRHFTPILAQTISSLCSKNPLSRIFLKFCVMVGYYFEKLLSPQNGTF